MNNEIKTYKTIIEKEKMKNDNELNILSQQNEKMEKYLELLAKQNELELKYMEQYCEYKSQSKKYAKSMRISILMKYHNYVIYFTNN